MLMRDLMADSLVLFVHGKSMTPEGESIMWYEAVVGEGRGLGP